VRARAIIALLGQYAIAYNLASVLHELGHAAAVTLSGGSVAAIRLNPFGWNWTIYRYAPSPILASWSGVLGGLLFSLLPYIGFVLARRLPPRLVLLLAMVSMALNGVYLVGSTLVGAGDGADLVRLGVPRLWPLTAGALLMALAALWFVRVQPRFGLSPTAGFAERCALLLGGIGSYLGFTVLYVAVFRRRDLLAFVCFVAVGLVFLVAVSAYGAIRGASRSAEPAPPVPGWRYAGICSAIGLAIILAELAVFGL